MIDDFIETGIIYDIIGNLITINLTFLKEKKKIISMVKSTKKTGKYSTNQRSITNDAKTPISTANNPVSNPTLLQAPKNKPKTIVVAGKKKI